jgi:hypothetical protein
MYMVGSILWCSTTKNIWSMSELTHEGGREWMEDEGIILIRTPQGLMFMDEHEAHPYQALPIEDYSVEELKLLMEEYLE